jgi:hypothetical protein
MQDEQPPQAASRRKALAVANGLVVTHNLSATAPGRPRPKTPEGRGRGAKGKHPSRGLGSTTGSGARSGAGAGSNGPAYAAAVKDALDQQARELVALRQRARAEVPPPPAQLSMALRMPQVHRSFRFIAGRRRRYELRRCFCKWYNAEVVVYHAAAAERAQRAAGVLQRTWRGFVARLRARRRKRIEAKKMVNAVNVVNRLCKVYKLRKAIRLKIAEKHAALVFPTAAAIQAGVRAFLGRHRFLRRAKRTLYAELRQWSGGRADRLLRRPGMLCYAMP